MQTEIVSPETENALPKFSELGLSDVVLKAVKDQGYETPTPIQAQAIPELLKGRDLIGGSQTGTGKTAAFSLPIISMLGEHGALRCLILEPTRELAQQVYDSFETYGKHSDLRVALLYGGVRYGRQREQLSKDPDVIIATPGRLLDFLGQKALSLKKLDYLVLDEADRMLDMGFMPDVRKIIGYCPKQRQSLLFSATVPPEIERLSKWVLNDPVTIRIGTGTSTADTIDHAVYPVDDRQKFDLLHKILDDLEYQSILIFCRTKMGADTVARWLDAADHGPVSILHSDRSQRERDSALKKFKEGESDILVATDIVARGIDISGISHVINYDIPQHPEDYVHRIGRTGRANREGDAVTLLTAAELDFLKAIERFIGQDIPRRTVDGFDYRWSPVFDADSKPKKKKRNRGYSTKVQYDFRRR